jgi:nucleoside-diphosphate-sugar epimerase
MNILITGIHGFVGTNLVAALKQQHTIYGLDIVQPQKEGVLKTFHWDELDLIPLIDIIIHLAGRAHDTLNNTDNQAYFDINVGLTQKIFEYFLQSNTTKFIFFSSVKAVADSVNGAALSEEEIPGPQTPYGKSKLEAERFIWERLNENTNAREEEKGRWGDGEKTNARGDDDTTARLDEGTNDRRHNDTTKLKEEKKVYILRPCMIHGQEIKET